MTAPTPHRERLPNRRRNVTITVTPSPIDGRKQRRQHVTVGFFDDGRPGEIFINAGRPDSDSDRNAADFGVLASMLLQSGFPAGHIAARLGRLGCRRPATIIGQGLDIAADERLDDIRPKKADPTPKEKRPEEIKQKLDAQWSASRPMADPMRDGGY